MGKVRAPTPPATLERQTATTEKRTTNTLEMTEKCGANLIQR